MLDILGIYLNRLVYKDFLASILKLEKQNIIFTPNPEIILKAQTDKSFKDILNKADILIPDGIGIFIAYQIISLKNKIKNKMFGIILSIILFPYFVFNIIFRKKYIYGKYGEKICGSDLTLDLVKFSEENGIKITIIDLYNPNDLNKIESQSKFVENLLNKYKNLKFDYFIYNTLEKDKIIDKIKNNDSKILFSTLGMKKQEESIIEIINQCKNIKIGIGIGSSFDYIIGFQKRAPIFFRNLGIEWLYRLITGPQKRNRLKRLWNAIFVFTYKIITK